MQQDKRKIPAQKIEPFHEYIQEIEKNLLRGNSTEHTHRPALKNLIEPWTAEKPSQRYLYVFLDESGNLDFSQSGTKFILTSLTKERPFEAYKPLTELKYDLVESNINIEYFHAAEDRQPVRNKVFDIIKNHLEGTRIDGLIIEKRKVEPALRVEHRFYPEKLGYLLTIENGL